MLLLPLTTDVRLHGSTCTRTYNILICIYIFIWVADVATKLYLVAKLQCYARCACYYTLQASCIHLHFISQKILMGLGSFLKVFNDNPRLVEEFR